MISCLICLGSIEHSVIQSVCIPGCGHVFHKSCILSWVATKGRSCPVCRCAFAPDSFIRLYFGTSRNVDCDVEDRLAENRECRRKIDILLQGIRENLDVIDRNTQAIGSFVSVDSNSQKVDVIDRSTQAAEPWLLDSSSEEDEEPTVHYIRSLAITLSRAEEEKKIQDYLDSINH